MAKASSGKKVARAARAGGGARARTAGERSLLFPVALGLVVVLGVLLIVVARDQRLATELERPVPGEDHWHAAYGFYVCDSYRPAIPEFPSATGIHTHGDGVIHIHPFSAAGGGSRATLGTFLEFAPGADIGNDTFEVAGEEFEDGYSCDGEEATARVLYWASAASADETEPEVITDDFDGIRFAHDGEAYAIVIAPPDAEVPPPPTSDQLVELGAEDGWTVNDRDINATTTTETPEDAADSDEESTDGDTDEGDDTDGS